MGEGAKRTRLGSEASVADRCACFHSGRAAQGGRSRGRARVRRDPDLQPELARVAAAEPRRRGEFAEFREAIDASRIGPVLIHAVYLINAAIMERRDSRQVARGAERGAQAGRPDRRCRRGAPSRLSQAASRLRAVMGAQGRRSARHWPRASGARCCSRTRPAPGGTLGRDFDELAELIELAGADERIGLCLDCCHMLASGYRDPERDALSEIVDEFEAKIGLERLRASTSTTPRCPSAAIATATRTSVRASLATGAWRVPLGAALRRLPALIETPGPGQSGTGPDLAEVRKAKRLRPRDFATAAA